jgi:glycolate oxidase
LKYGFTVNHVVEATIVLADGEIVRVGEAAVDPLGYDLTAAVVGSEGLVGIVTEAVVRILRVPEATRTFFATFPSTDEAGACVSEIVAAGIVPAAVEMMDALAMEAIVKSTGVDWPLDVGASILMDVDGTRAEVDHTANAAVEIATRTGAIEVRTPKNDAERALMWKGRKGAFAAMGRVGPNYYVQDGVIPRSEISKVLREIAAAASREGLRVANVFHAGDGNLHPLVLYDARVPGEEHRAETVAGEILRICIRYGGSITGEHGVGVDKAVYMGELFTDADLETMNFVRCAFDPERAFNPGKVFPTPRLCGDVPGTYAPHAAETAGVGRG